MVELESPTQGGAAQAAPSAAEGRRVLRLDPTIGAAYDEATEGLARIPIPSFADGCIVDVIEDDGSVRRVVEAHADPAGEAALRALRRVRATPRPDTDPFYHALVKREPILIREVDDELIASVAASDEHAELIRRADIRSSIIVPLQARGRLVGVMSFVRTGDARAYAEEDIAFAERFAQGAALAIDNARLLRDVQQNERRFRDVIDSVEAIVWEADARTGRLEYISRYVEEVYGVPTDAWLEDPALWLTLVHPDDRDAVAAARATATADARDHVIEYRVLRADGETRWLRDAVRVVRDEHGRASTLRGLTMDVTASVITNTRIQAQHACTRALAEATSLAEAAPAILGAICDTLGWDVGAIWELDASGSTLRCTDVHTTAGIDAPEFVAVTRTLGFERGTGLPGRIWSTGEAAWIPDVVGDTNFPRAPIAAREGMHAAFGFPLTIRGSFVGVMEFFSREIRRPDDDLLSMMTAVGSQIGLFVERRRVEQENLFQRALLESQSEATPDGVLVVAPDGTILSFNQRFVTMWDIPESVVASRNDDAAIESVLEKVIDPERFVARIRELYGNLDEESRDEIPLRDGRILDRRTAPLRDPDGRVVGRAWYFRDVTEEKTEERHARFLAEATGLLTTSLDFDATIQRFAEMAVPALADWCVVDIVEGGRSVRRAAAVHSDPNRDAVVRRLEVLRPYDVDLDSPRGVGKVIATGRADWAEEIADEWLVEESGGDEAFLHAVRAMGFRSYVCVPMAARGRIVGVLTLVHADSGRRFGEADVSFVQDLAGRAALALDNLRLYRERSHIARTLQESLLPPSLPEIPGLEVAARYQAAGEAYDVGGDFYDLFLVGRRTWAIVVGDVYGKGPEAAALTALARYTLRAAAMQARHPKKILATLNEAINRQHDGEKFCTVAYANVTLLGGDVRLTISYAGHPLGVALRADGAVEQIGRPGVLLGAFADIDLKETTLLLQPGDAFVLYTDGVTEARGPAGFFGEQRLRSLIETCRGEDAEGIVEIVARRAIDFQDGVPRDDIAVVAVRVPPAD